MLGPFFRLAEETHQPLLGYNTWTPSTAGMGHGTPLILHDWTTDVTCSRGYSTGPYATTSPKCPSASLQSSDLLSRSVPKQFKILLLKIHLSRNKSLTVAACYRPPSAPSCALDTICELIAPHLSSELVLLDDLNWDMLNTPAILESKPDALNLTQMINEHTMVQP